MVLDRVIGGSVYLEEAKRISNICFLSSKTGTRPRGYRILSYDLESVHTCRP